MIQDARGVTRSHLIRGVEFVAGKSYRTLDHTRVLDVHEVRRMPRNVHALVSVGDRPSVWVDVRYTGREELITVEDAGVVYIASARREAVKC